MVGRLNFEKKSDIPSLQAQEAAGNDSGKCLNCIQWFGVADFEQSVFLPTQVHPWLTKGGQEPLPLEEEHCTVVEVTEEEVKNSVKTIPSLPAVVCINHNSLFEWAKIRILWSSQLVKKVWRVHVCCWPRSALSLPSYKLMSNRQQSAICALTPASNDLCPGIWAHCLRKWCWNCLKVAVLWVSLVHALDVMLLNVCWIIKEAVVRLLSTNFSGMICQSCCSHWSVFLPQRS